MKDRTKIYNYYNLGIRILILVLAYLFLYKQLFYNHDLPRLWAMLQGAVVRNSAPGLLLMIALGMVANWGLEGLKWQMLVCRIEKISYWGSLKAVFAGITVSFFTPNRVGEFLGRVFILEKANRFDGSLLSIVGSLSQLLVTLVAGIIALMLFIPRYAGGWIDAYPLLYLGFNILCLFSILTLLLFFFNIEIFSRIDKLLPVLTRIRGWSGLSVLTDFHYIELMKVLFVSFLRYFIFNGQLFLLLNLFGVQVSFWENLILTALLFFAMSAIPTVAFAELGVRGSVAVFFFGFYFSSRGMSVTDYSLAIISGTSALWLINVALPALLGTFFVGKLRFFRK